MTLRMSALVPMKGHSERIPGKNARSFCGMPLFFRIMNILAASKHIDSIIVDTDSKKLKKAVTRYWPDVLIIDRPAKICGDKVSMNKVIQYDLSKTIGEHFIQTHSTNPLLRPSTVDAAIEKYFHCLRNGYDSLFSVTRHQSRFYDKNSTPVNHDLAHLIRTQDLDPLFEENSTFYIFSKRSFLKNKRRIGVKPYMYEINKIEAVDIDDKEDFNIAEALFKSMRCKRKR